jgi:glycerol-3-phosphate acyltransferase PlsY
LSAIFGYLIGSISFSRLVLKLKAPGKDISDLAVAVEGTGEAAPVKVYGANAASMILGTKYGIGIGILDMLKVAVPMLIFRFFVYPNSFTYLAVSVGALMGHNWPVYYRFRGGRGFSVIFGSFVIIDWFGAIIEPIFGIMLGMFLVRNIMFAYSSWLWLLPVWFWFRVTDSGALFLVFYSIIIILIFTIATIPEIKTVAKYRREGKLSDYQNSLFDSSPRWRGMKSMQDKINDLRKRGYLVGLLIAVLLIIVLLGLQYLPAWIQLTLP